LTLIKWHGSNPTSGLDATAHVGERTPAGAITPQAAVCAWHCSRLERLPTLHR